MQEPRTSAAGTSIAVLRACGKLCGKRRRLRSWHVEERDLASRRRDAAVAFNVPVGIRFSTFWTGNWISQRRPTGDVATGRKLIQNIYNPVRVSRPPHAFLSKNNTMMDLLWNFRLRKIFRLKYRANVSVPSNTLMYICVSARITTISPRSLSVSDALR